jgi:hypothetical protein
MKTRHGSPIRAASPPCSIDLDAAVAAAYGWPADLTDEQTLERLFKLNQERAARQ